MKLTQKNKDIIKKSKKNTKVSKEQILVVTQEIKFARLLSGNEKKTRDRILKALKKWLSGCFQKGYQFKEDDFIRVWKGLFYAVWMSDKPLIQEELCESIAGVLDLFPIEEYKYAILMTKAGFKVLATEWYGIDQHRMDKFLMLVRRYLRGALRCLERNEWREECCQQFANMISGCDGILAAKTPLYARNATSMVLHFIDCYLEEISKVSQGNIDESSITALLTPMCQYMCVGENEAVATACRRLMTALVRQSEVGLEYHNKQHAWQKMDCPVGGPDALELDEDDSDSEGDGQVNGDSQPRGEDKSEDEDEQQYALDPRAGHVDTLLCPLPVPSAGLAAVLRQALVNAKPKAHRRAKICLQRLEAVAKHEYPLKLDASDVTLQRKAKLLVKERARHLKVIEAKYIADSDELALRGLRRKHRKRLLAKIRAGLSIVEDVSAVTHASKHARDDAATNGDWKVETAEPSKKKAKNNTVIDTDINNKENVNRKRKQPHETNSANENKKSKVTDNIKKDDEKAIVNKKQKAVKTNLCKDKPVKDTLKTTKVENRKSCAENNDTNNKSKGLKLLFKEKLKKSENEAKKPTLNVNKLKKFQKQTVTKQFQKQTGTFKVPENLNMTKKVKFVLKNNSMQGPVDYYKSVRQSPSIPFDGHKRPSKTNLKVCTPSPINPFFKKKMKLK